MSMIKALRTLAAIENGTLNATTLETQVAGSQARKDEISQLLSAKSLHERIASSRNAMDALAGSATAWGEAMKHRYITNFIAACVESVNAKMAFYNSDTALNAIAASPSVMALMRAASKYSVTFIGIANTTNSVAMSSVSGAANIVLGISHSVTTPYNYTLSTLRSGSAISASVATASSNNVLGKDFDIAVPLTSAYSFTSVAGNSSPTYLGILRCDA